MSALRGDFVMFKATKDGKSLVELSLKQRDQWVFYVRDRAASMPVVERPGTPFPFVEQPPRMAPRRKTE